MSTTQRTIPPSKEAGRFPLHLAGQNANATGQESRQGSHVVSENSAGSVENLLLGALPFDEYDRLAAGLQPVHFPRTRVLYEAGDPMRHAIFINRGVASVLAITEDGQTIEIGTVGSEGFVGIPTILGTDRATYRVMAQTRIEAFKIDAGLLRQEFNRGDALHRLLLRYANVLQAQTVQAVVCKLFHPLQPRLSRWLLTFADCLEADDLRVTHEQMASMLCAHRNRISVAANILRKQGLIDYGRRGWIKILDRRGLKADACECYGIVRECIEQTFKE